MYSSTPLEKEISTLAVLIMQMLLAEVVDEVDVYETFFPNVTGTILSICCGIFIEPVYMRSLIVGLHMTYRKGRFIYVETI